jgi:RHS repeat-associated protein
MRRLIWFILVLIIACPTKMRSAIDAYLTIYNAGNCNVFVAVDGIGGKGQIVTNFWYASALSPIAPNHSLTIRMYNVVKTLDGLYGGRVRELAPTAATLTGAIWSEAFVVIGAPGSCTTNCFLFSPDDLSDGVLRQEDQPPCGMPVWSVSEPHISLWLRDEPLGYQPALGRRLSFELAFKQREYTVGYATNIFNFGRKWNCSWLSYITQDANTNLVAYFPGGGARTYYTTNDYLTQTTLSGDATNGFTITYPDGSRDVYGFIVTNGSGVFQSAFMTKRLNPQAQKTTFNYFNYAPSSPVIRLQNVIDGDGRTNTIVYTNNAYSTNLISKVIDPFGRTAFMNYDSYGELTKITDVASNATTLSYDVNWCVTNMTTPYGTTTFKVTGSSNNIPPNGRSILVTRPDNSHELYYYKDSAPGVTNWFPDVPDTSPFANTFENTNLDVRNSFHWGPRQYAALSTTNLPSLTSNDFTKAKMQHWLAGADNVVGNTLSMEREPSPDSSGTIQGQKTWYDYAGKTNDSYEGTQSVPLFVARVLPDSSATFSRTERNSLGNVMTNISTYTAVGGISLRTNFYDYADNGVDLLAMTDALGVQVVGNVYNAFHQVATNFNALNEQTIFTYDTNQQLLTATLPTGLVITNIYGPSNLLASSIVIGYATNSFTWTNDLVLTHTDPRGLSVTNTWDALNRLTSTKYPDGSYISNRYTALDLTATKDRLGYWTYFGYDKLQRNTSITNALLNVTTFNYCTCGALDSIVDALTNVTQFYYDNQGNLTNTIYPDYYTVTRTYNLLRQAVNVSDSSGNSLTTTFNNQGLPLTVSNLFGQVAAYGYDTLDRVTNSTDANAVIVSTAYDDLNRPLSRTYPDSGVEYFGYTPNYAYMTGYTNQIGNVMLYGYDPLNRKTNEVSVGVTTNRYVYSGAGDLLELIDGKNQTNSWNCDAYGRVTNKVDAAGTVVFVYKYDADNRLTNRWSAAKNGIAYRYDPVGNLTNIAYPVSSNIFLSYDVLNRLTNLVDGVGSTVYSYDASGQLLGEDGPWTNDTVSYTYTNRLRSALSLLQPDSSPWTESYGYDSARRLNSLVSPAGLFNYSYDPVKLQLVKSLGLPNGANITNSYDNVGRLTGTALLNSGGTILDQYVYGYNQAGQRMSVTRTAGDYVNYTYDNMGELKTAQGSEAGGASRWQEQLGYVYDAAGNLNIRTNNALIQDFSVNQLNELTTLTRSGTFTVAGTTSSGATNVMVGTSNATLYADHMFASTNHTLTDGINTFTAIAWDFLGNVATNVSVADLEATRNFVYDSNGNLRTNDTRIFDYDDENQLIRVTETDSWKEEFVYDGQLRRRVEKDYTWSGSSWIQTNEVHFIYNGYAVIQERDSNNVPLVTYTRDMSGLRARTDDNGSAYYHADGNANITMLVNENQAVVAKYVYDPFGSLLSMRGSLAAANIYRFSSKQWDANIGFYYFGFRYYDPNLQRWPNQDPIQEAGGLNLYEFVRNNPINLFDPFGLIDTGPQGGYVDPFGNWHMSFCMSCHDNTPAGNFYRDQSMLANNQSWGVFAYQQGLGLGLGLGLGGIADDLASQTMMDARLLGLMSKKYHPGTDCSEIAQQMRQAANGEGNLLRVTPANPGSLNLLEGGSLSGDNFYHEVYSDGNFIYDPRFSSVPSPVGVWTQLILRMNPGASIMKR